MLSSVTATQTVADATSWVTSTGMLVPIVGIFGLAAAFSIIRYIGKKMPR